MSAFAQWSLPVESVMSASPVVPVIVLDQLSHALPMAEALLNGGISVMEVTLRTPVALAAISAIANEFPQALVGAGTVCNRDQLMQVYDAGGKFAISPGGTPSLLAAAAAGPIPLLPGISTVSELMAGMELGYQHFKFFPAEAAGGVKALKAISGPFPGVSFCPTGGISTSNYLDYLHLGNVSCVGGSWLVPADAMAAGEFGSITRLAREALQRVR